MPSVWVQHIKDFAAANNLSYGCALSDTECSRTYREKYPKKTKNPPKKKNAPAPPPVITPVPTPPPPPVRLVAAEPTGNPKLMQKGIEIKRPMSEFDFKEIELPKKVKEKRIAKKAPEKKVELVVEEEKSVSKEPTKREILTTLIQMVADNDSDLPAPIKKIRDLFRTYYDEIYRAGYSNKAKREAAKKAIFTDYLIKAPTVSAIGQKGGDDLYYFLEDLIFFGYKHSLDYIKLRYERLKSDALRFTDLPHIPYLLGNIKRVIDKMKNVKLGKKSIRAYLTSKFDEDTVLRMENGMEPLPFAI